MRTRDLFRLFPKRLASGRVVYYYTAYDEEGRRRQFSTGCRTKTAAHRVAAERYRAGRLVAEREVRFSTFTDGWFRYESCPYIRGKLLRGHRYSRTHADHQRGQLSRYLIPAFGAMKLRAIRTVHIERWLFAMKERGLANVTVNHALSTLRLILAEAARRGEIDANPALTVAPLADDAKEKGVPSRAEVARLFAPGALESVWSGNRLQYLLNKTASLTGMRLGELQALRKEHLHREHLHVCHSWDRRYGLKGTKTEEARDVPIPASLSQELAALASEQSTGAYLFSADGGGQPVDHKAVYKWMRRAYAVVGVREAALSERRISFHSWRHYLNSQLRAHGVPDGLVRVLTGHRTQRMTEHYSHFAAEDFDRVREVHRSIAG